MQRLLALLHRLRDGGSRDREENGESCDALKQRQVGLGLVGQAGFEPATT